MDGWPHGAERTLFCGRWGANHITFHCGDVGFSIRRNEELVSEWLVGDVAAAVGEYLLLVERPVRVTVAA